MTESLPKTKYAAYPMLDFPTAWRIVNRGLIHTTWRCSYVQTSGTLLCDCPALEREWDRMVSAGWRFKMNALGYPR